MDKEDVAHIYNGILLSLKRNEMEVFVVDGPRVYSVVKDGPSLQSEVSQKEKNKYRMLTHIYGI